VQEVEVGMMTMINTVMRSKASTSEGVIKRVHFFISSAEFVHVGAAQGMMRFTPIQIEGGQLAGRVETPPCAQWAAGRGEQSHNRHNIRMEHREMMMSVSALICRENIGQIESTAHILRWSPFPTNWMSFNTANASRFTLAQHNLSKNFRKTVFVIFEAFFPHPNDRLLSPDLRGVVVHSGRAHVWREAQSWSWQSGACAVVCHRTGRLISYTMLTHFMSEKGVFMNTLSQIHKFSEF
jgi:hypothetical protein